MRVIAGRAKGRRLRTLAGDAVRPTADRTKEALFSILQSRFELGGARVLDLFAGTGALGIEALSRGAAASTFVEKHPSTVRILRGNIEACGFTAESTVVTASVARALSDLAARGAVFDGVLADPPYGTALLVEALATLGDRDLVHVGGWVIVERHTDDRLDAGYGKLRLTQTRCYGKTSLDLFQREKGSDEN